MHRRGVEERIMDYVLDGDIGALTKAIKLISEGCDYNRLHDLGRKWKKSGRLLKTILLADDILVGKIKPDSVLREIQRLSASAGHHVSKAR
jgi:hypothetical protein